MADKYLLRVTVGSSYDPSTHTVFPVNSSQSILVSSEHCTARVQVRVQNYRGLPHGSPTSSDYFSHPSHIHDLYSVSISFVPHKTVPGESLVFGNDFDRPIRDRLPPGFGTAFKIVKWAIDPGLDGDPYADQPHLYGPALSSFNALRVGGKARKTSKDTDERKEYEIPELGEEVVEEGADGDGEESRDETDAPDTAAERKKWALGQEQLKSWKWEEGRLYKVDFFNPYLDFNQFALKLPGFSLGVLNLLGRNEHLRRTHEFRYVLKNKETDDVFLVVLFTLIMKEDLEKEEAQESEREAKEKEGTKEAQAPKFQPSEDDID